MPSSAVVARLRAAGCVFAEDEARVLAEAARTPAELDEMVSRRAGGLPLEQVVGWAGFCGLRIVVEPGVFVPRRRSELLAREALARAAAWSGTPVAIDMCCGSGALGAVLGRAGVEVYAAEIDPVAVACARHNLPADRVFEGDLFAPLPRQLRGRVAVLVANAPYVPTDELAFMPAEARLYEAEVALDGGADGLDVQRRVIAEAPEWLAPGGTLLIETSRRQAAGTVAAVEGAGLVAEVVGDEELDATVVLGTSYPGSAGRSLRK